MTEQENLRYTPEHEWLEVDGDIVTVGITAYAAGKLGDVVFVDLPAVGASVVSGRVVAEIESTKSVGELYAPATGMVIQVNDAVAANPELVNSDPFGGGWLVKLSFDELAATLSFDEYRALVGE